MIKSYVIQRFDGAATSGSIADEVARRTGWVLLVCNMGLALGKMQENGRAIIELAANHQSDGQAV
jgi:hypothetical protein